MYISSKKSLVQNVHKKDYLSSSFEQFYSCFENIMILKMFVRLVYILKLSEAVT